MEIDIQALSTGMAQQQVQEEAAIKVQNMALNTAEAQSAALTKLMDAAEVITDPNLGKQVNFLA
jgi:hypothetical protein